MPPRSHHAAIQPDSEDVILVRFIDPPQQVKDRVEAAKAQARRSKSTSSFRCRS